MQEQMSLLPSLSLLETQIPLAPAEQGKGQAGLVCPQLQSNPGTGTQTFRDESPSSSGALQGPQGSGSKLHSRWSTRASSSRLLPPAGTGAALRGEQQEGRQRGNPFRWHLSATRAAGLPS